MIASWRIQEGGQRPRHKYGWILYWTGGYDERATSGFNLDGYEVIEYHQLKRKGKREIWVRKAK